MEQASSLRGRTAKVGTWLLATVVFAVIAIWLQDRFGFPFDTTYRIACAGMCLYVMTLACADYRGEQWTRFALAAAFAVNAGLFLTPLFDRPAARGEIMMFAAPDATILLMTRAITYPVIDQHTRAVRQQIVFGAVLALATCGLLIGLLLLSHPQN